MNRDSGGFAARTLHTNGDAPPLERKRPAAINGIVPRFSLCAFHSIPRNFPRERLGQG